MPSLGCILQLRLAGKSPDSLVSYTSGLKCLKRRELGDEQLLQGSVCELVLPGILTALLESKILMWSKAEGAEQTTSKDHCVFFFFFLWFCKDTLNILIYTMAAASVSFRSLLHTFHTLPSKSFHHHLLGVMLTLCYSCFLKDTFHFKINADKFTDISAKALPQMCESLTICFPWRI